MQSFSVVCKSSLAVEPKRWLRFKKLVAGDYMFMGCSYYDGIVFIPKVNIHFFGWGLFASYRGHDQAFHVRWKIDDDYSEKYEVSFRHEERDPENNWHEVDLRTLGVSPIYCPAGTRVNVLAYPDEDEMRRTWYGEEGRIELREQIPDQENIFDVERSDERYDTSENYGQFPYILYAEA